MKGVLLLSKLFSFFVLLALGSFMMGFIIVAAEFYSGIRTFDITIGTVYLPVKYDLVLLTFLECTDPDTGIPIKRIITALAAQQPPDGIIYLDGNLINVKDVSNELLYKILGDRPYFLKIANPEIIIAGDSSKLSQKVYKTSTKLFLFDGSTVDLELYVG